MKNVLTYISPDKDFNDEHKMAVKIQIDNSLRLGWDKDDLLLVTNFDYEYKGVKSMVIGDENYCNHFYPATKVYVIDYLFKNNLVNDFFWYHDFDSFQLNPFDKGFSLNADMGVSNYGRMPRICSSSMFYNPQARDLFDVLKEDIVQNQIGEEWGIMRLREKREYVDRIKVLNISYAFHKWNLWHNYCRAEKPIKVVHFHLTPDKYDFFVRGNNRVGLKIIPEELVEIFHKHGFNG
jgi:hypothetical protein